MKQALGRQMQILGKEKKLSSFIFLSFLRFHFWKPDFCLDIFGLYIAQQTNLLQLSAETALPCSQLAFIIVPKQPIQLSKFICCAVLCL